jgi:carbonic anhydrase
MQPTDTHATVDAVDGLVAGFRSFRARYYEQSPERMHELSTHGQSPTVMVIACSDSRVDPALLLGAEPGDLFTVRNVANLVPPYTPDSNYHGTSAALEFAVRDLKVHHIVILGHSACGGIQALRDAAAGAPAEREFIAPWMDIAAAACPCEDGRDVPDQPTVEHESVRISLTNLRSFPWVDERIRTRELTLHGWWVDLVGGHLCEIKPEGGTVDMVPTQMEISGAAD